MRYSQIDFFRGLMLILMSLNHTGGPINFLSSQPFGFISAAAGFVFLSGLTAGIVYSRKYTRLGMNETSRMVWRRSWKIYRYHIGLMFFLITLSLLFPPVLHHFWADPDDFMKNLPERIIGALILKEQPYFHDILPMYVIFMAFTPTLLQALNTRRIEWVIAGTFLLWLAAQIIWYVFPGLNPYIPGSFNPFTWQLLFFTGILMGHLTQKGTLNSLLENRTLFVFSFTISAVLLVMNWLFKLHTIHAISLSFYDSDIFHYLTDRKNFGFLRLINMTALSFSIAYLFKKNSSWGHNRWICLLGRNSLPVFTFHIVLMVLTKPYIDRAFDSFPFDMLTINLYSAITAVFVYISIPALTTLSLLIPATYMVWFETIISSLHAKKM